MDNKSSGAATPVMCVETMPTCVGLARRSRQRQPMLLDTQKCSLLLRPQRGATERASPTHPDFAPPTLPTPVRQVPVVFVERFLPPSHQKRREQKKRRFANIRERGYIRERSGKRLACCCGGRVSFYVCATICVCVCPTPTTTEIMMGDDDDDDDDAARARPTTQLRLLCVWQRGGCVRRVCVCVRPPPL